MKDAGGFRTEKGSGVDRKRCEQYRVAVRELIQITGKHFPIEMTIDDVRGYINSIQASDKAIATKRACISTLTNLFAVGMRYGLLDRNVFQGMQIKVSKNTRQHSYRRFVKDELQLIGNDLRNSRNQARAMIVKAFLATGARSSSWADHLPRVDAVQEEDLNHCLTLQHDQGIWMTTALSYSKLMAGWHVKMTY